MIWTDFLAERDYAGRWIADLGDDHVIRLSYGDPERFPDGGWPRSAEGLVLVGGLMNHRTPDGNTCGGGVSFIRPLSASESEAKWALWTIDSLEPLTLSPSLLCHCGDHGFIREGRWVRA